MGRSLWTASQTLPHTHFTAALGLKQRACWSTCKWGCRWSRCWATAVCFWISSIISFCVWILHSCQFKKAEEIYILPFLSHPPSLSPTLSLHQCLALLWRCRGAGRISAVVFVWTEGTRSGGMTASESCGWQRCCYNLKPESSLDTVIQKDLGHARWPDQTGGCQCSETRERGSQNIWKWL